MSIFGWSYPTGAANDPNAPYNQNDDGPCEVCGKATDDCICPECPVCENIGDITCYENHHGMTRTKAQIDSLSNAEAGWAEQAQAEAESEAAYYADMDKHDRRE